LSFDLLTDKHVVKGNTGGSVQIFHHAKAISHTSGILDVVATPSETRVFCQDGVAPPLEGIATGIPAGIFVTLPTKADIEIAGETIQPAPAQTALFDGLNTLLAIEYNPDPQDLTDWLTFNVTHAGLEAVLLVRRLPEKRKQRHPVKGIRKAVNGIAGLKRFVLLDYSVPLGSADEIAESERLLAPEAPGKALLERPEPDPWRAPLAEFAVYAAARFRFLSSARAVLHCRLGDLILAGPNVFDAAVSSHSYIKLTARNAYPWKIAEPGNIRITDHTCKRFDSTNGGTIWCARPDLDGFWRPFRASATQAERPADVPKIWRCTGLLHKHLNVAELVPKSSLIGAPSLIREITETFTITPFTPPPREKPAEGLKNDRILAVTTMKDEGPFILEWIAYHRSIGVTDFLVYTNDCSDGTDEMFDLLQAKGYVQHRENPYRAVGLKPQHAAYLEASETDIAKQADWVVCMDVDEYINIHVGDGTLAALFKAIGGANMISLTWRLFGNADIEKFNDEFIIGQFFRAAPPYIRKPHQAWGFKTMFRPLGYYKKFGVHRPKGLRPEAVDQVKWVNSNGHALPPKMLRNGWRSSSGNWGYGLVTLNHYALRSAESFLVKRFRGRVNHVDRDQGLPYWFRMNNNATEDRSILDKLPRARAEYDRMMSDPEISAMHKHCVAAHKSRIDTLMENKDYRALFDEITGDRLQALSQRLHYFGSQIFMDGPDSVREEFEHSTPSWDETPTDHPLPPSVPDTPAFAAPKGKV